MHGIELESVHFHEVGAIDSIVDIVGVAVALCDLKIERLWASPTPTGSGLITIAHGQVSVPRATAELLRGIPLRASTVDAELTTPTGAAILATLVDGFGPLPSMQIESIGYGAGHRELYQQANMLRVLIGKSVEGEAIAQSGRLALGSADRRCSPTDRYEDRQSAGRGTGHHDHHDDPGGHDHHHDHHDHHHH